MQAVDRGSVFLPPFLWLWESKPGKGGTSGLRDHWIHVMLLGSSMRYLFRMQIRVGLYASTVDLCLKFCPLAIFPDPGTRLGKT